MNLCGYTLMTMPAAGCKLNCNSISRPNRYTHTVHELMQLRMSASVFVQLRLYCLPLNFSLSLLCAVGEWMCAQIFTWANASFGFFNSISIWRKCMENTYNSSHVERLCKRKIINNLFYGNIHMHMCDCGHDISLNWMLVSNTPLW